MSQPEKEIKYPAKDIIAFYETAKSFELRLDLLLGDVYKTPSSITPTQKSIILDTLLASRAIIRTVEEHEMLPHGDEEVVMIRLDLATILSQLLMTLAKYEKSLYDRGITLALQ
jgi:hypothetical protein